MKRKKHQAEMYLPLAFTATNKEYAPGEAFSSITGFLRKMCTLPENLEEDEYIRYMH